MSAVPCLYTPVVNLCSPPSGIPESGLFFSDKDFMDIVSFQMDLLRLGSAVGQLEQFPAQTQPALAESLEELASLETVEISAVAAGFGR